MSEFGVDVINISKIKEGFHVGDELAATNLDVIIQLKLTHMINAAGSQIINAWETIGIKYLTLNWSENPSQNLFDSKDEIANRIVLFIDDSSSKGEGLLVHSVRGQNRVCLVVLIYLMKKYKWRLIKSLEFLRSKKKDINIPKYFLNQLTLFEQRMIKKGEEIINIPWTELNDDNSNDADEKLMVNTYLNGLPNSPGIKDNQVNFNKRHINWADNNPYKKEPLFSFNPAKDLFNQKEIKPVTAHKRLHALKSCIKKKISKLVKSEDITIVTNDLNAEMAKFNNSVSINTKSNPTQLSSLNETAHLASNDYLINYSKLYEEKKNENRPKSVQTPIDNSNTKLNEQKAIMLSAMESTKEKNIISIMPISIPVPKQINAKLNEKILKEENDNKIVITNNYEQIVNNNINNYYIQNTLGEIGQTMNKVSNVSTNSLYTSNNDLNSKIINHYDNNNNNNNSNNNNTATPLYFNNFVSNMKNSNSEKQYTPIQLNTKDPSQTNNGINNKAAVDNNTFSGLINLNSAKINKQTDTQKMNKNAFLNNNIYMSYTGNSSGLKVVDYVNNNSNINYIPISKDNDLKAKVIDSMNQPHQQQEQESIVNLINFQQTKPLNNYNPTLNKKNSYSTSALFNKPQKPVSVKVANNELYLPKTSTPNQITSITYLNKDKNPMYLNNYGVIHRSNSKGKDNRLPNRPLIEFQKDHKEFAQYSQSNMPLMNKMGNLKVATGPSTVNNPNIMKRLPSPQLESNTILTRTQKITQEKYRPPTPVMKSSNFSLGSIKRGLIQKKYI